jgi:hypothetical protein
MKGMVLRPPFLGSLSLGMRTIFSSTIEFSIFPLL